MNTIRFSFLLYWLMVAFVGTVCFVPDIVVDRFHTATYLFGGICFGGIGAFLSILLKKEAIPLPSVNFLLIVALWLGYQIYCTRIDLTLLSRLLFDCIAFVVAYCILWGSERRTLIYSFFALLGVGVAAMGLFQYIGIICSFHSSFSLTGPFDNPAGISAMLVALFPFSLFLCRRQNSRKVWIGIVFCTLIGFVVVLSGARTAVFAYAVVLFGYLLDSSFFRLYRKWIIGIGAIGATVLLLFLYLVHVDSSNGRLLIWHCCLDLIANNPLWGVGEGGFRVYYMPTQANYFINHPSESWSILSDNIYHPFNEYLRVTIEQGLVGLVLAIILLAYPIWSCKRWGNGKKQALLSLVAIGICSFFSYPLDYPVIRLSLVFSMALLILPDSKDSVQLKWNKKWTTLFLVLSLVCVVSSTWQGYNELKWKKLIDSDFPVTDAEYRDLRKNGFFYRKSSFLYSYGVMLYEAGLFRESIDVLKQCGKLANDYDIQLIQAYNYLGLNQTLIAEQHFRTSAAMIPNRFLPLYELFRIYEKQQNESLARQFALRIAAMPVKIPSPKVSFMKEEVDNYLSNHSLTERR